MKLTNPEKLILTMLCDIYSKLDIDAASGLDAEFIKGAIFSGNSWGIRWRYPVIFGGDQEAVNADYLPPAVSEVVNFLDMWMFIEESYEDLTAIQIQELNSKLTSPGCAVDFRGFDSVKEADYLSIALFLINDLERFQWFSERNLENQTAKVDDYRRMYQVFLPMRKTLIGHFLSVDQLAALLSCQNSE
jgi:uncharacterized protein YfbU (UPF0304 family)